ncbi:DUF1707 SHOCT-like domain-containing protein [Streptacidiphilus anmyonensis]|uniref:DUF1707 SHOCT-like domain-containing protein n=1 Tax=Streptacidiphilus anmyonensis TaxID=405782 RepID=UPI0009FFB728|nr:DUF1707 domain-containing protein [Streptacidiphilus anmyonensis]
MPGETSPAGNGPGPARGPLPELRASHADRDRTVDLLRVAAGDGRLTSDELDERLEAALSARTVVELAELTADLPPVSVFAGGAVEARDLLRIEHRFSAVKRVGPWVVPRRLELCVEWCDVTLDFTQAVITHDTLQIDMDMRGKNLTLVVGPGIVVDPYGLSLEFSKVRNRQVPAPGAPIALRIELTGKKSFGRVVVRHPRRTAGRRLLRRPGALPAGE